MSSGFTLWYLVEPAHPAISVIARTNRLKQRPVFRIFHPPAENSQLGHLVQRRPNRLVIQLHIHPNLTVLSLEDDKLAGRGRGGVFSHATATGAAKQGSHGRKILVMTALFHSLGVYAQAQRQ